MLDTLKDLSRDLYLIPTAALFGLWIYAIVIDAEADRLAWLIADLAIPPLGMVRGFGFLL
jgi:hypothetical protein